MYPKILISVRKSIRLYERQDHTVEIFIFWNFSFTIPLKWASLSSLKSLGRAMQKSRISTDRNVAFTRIDTDTDGHKQTPPTKLFKTPGFEVTVWFFVPNLILLLNSFNFSVVNPLNFMAFMQVYRLQLPLFKLYFCQLCMDNTVPYIVSVHCNLVKTIFIASLSYFNVLSL